MMENDVYVKVFNKLVGGKIFNYNDIFISTLDLTINFDYKVRAIESKKLISVGEWYDYLVVELEIVKANNDLAEIFFSEVKKQNLDGSAPSGRMMGVIHIIQNFLDFYIKLIDRNLRITIPNFVVNIPEINKLNEQGSNKNSC